MGLTFGGVTIGSAGGLVLLAPGRLGEEEESGGSGASGGGGS